MFFSVGISRSLQSVSFPSYHRWQLPACLPMKFSCPACDGHLTAKPEQAGDEVPCPHCGSSLIVPAESPITADTNRDSAGALATDPAAQIWAWRYSAFISYHHADNRGEGRRWAEWLHQALETYEIPHDLVGTTNQRGEIVPESLFPVFRHEEDLSADGDRTANIRKALEESAAVIVICSPRACKSRLINEEIRIFKELGRSDRILVLMIDGEPNASDNPEKRKRFGKAKECLPLALRTGVPREDGTIDWEQRTEPFWADVRPEGLPMEGFTTVEAFRRDVVERVAAQGETCGPKLLQEATDKYFECLELGILKIVAGILGLPLGMLTERDDKWKLGQARKKARNPRLWLLAGILLALCGGVAAWLKQSEVLRQRNVAQYNEGLGWLLRAEVAEERQNRYPETLLYAARATGFEGAGREKKRFEISFGRNEPFPRLIRKGRNPETYQEALDWIHERPTYLPVWSSEIREGAAATGLDFSPAGRWLGLSAEDGSVRLWDLESGDRIEVSPAGENPARDIAFHPDGGILAVAEKDRVRLWDLKRGAFSGDLEGDAHALAFSPNGKILAGAGARGPLLLWQNKVAESTPTGQFAPAASLAFNSDNSAVAVAFPKAGIRLLFHHVAESHSAWAEHREPVAAVAFSPDGARLAAGTADGEVSLWDVAGARRLGVVVPRQKHGGAVADLDFSPDGQRLASASADGTVKLWDTASDTPDIVVTLVGHVGAVQRVGFAPGGQVLASAGADGSARLWDVSGTPWEAGEVESDLGEETAEEPNLFPYLAESWYRFDEKSQELRWDAGAGFLNLPASSVIGIRRAGGDGLFGRLLETRDWTGATLAAEQPGERDRLADRLLADAEVAADKFRWHRVRLRLGQIEKLGAGSGAKAASLAKRMAAIADQGSPFTNGEGMDLIWCPSGEFTMGLTSSSGKFKTHRVILTHGFWLAKTEVTQAQYEAVMGHNRSTFVSSGPNAPAEDFSWLQAMEFCRKLTDRERARGAVPAGWEYTLPTEAQWEYACRAGTTTVWSFGNNESEFHKYGNFIQDNEHDGTAPVGEFRPNPWGFFDMHGNVSEWCRDAIDPDDCEYPAGSVNDPLVTSGPERVFRGGGWGSTAAECCSAVRESSQPAHWLNHLGMRAALVPSGPPVKYKP